MVVQFFVVDVFDFFIFVQVFVMPLFIFLVIFNPLLYSLVRSRFICVAE